MMIMMMMIVSLTFWTIVDYYSPCYARNITRTTCRVSIYSLLTLQDWKIGPNHERVLDWGRVGYDYDPYNKKIHVRKMIKTLYQFLTDRKLPRFESSRLNCASVTHFPGVVVRYGIGSLQKKYPTTVTSRWNHVTSGSSRDTFLYNTH